MAVNRMPAAAYGYWLSLFVGTEELVVDLFSSHRKALVRPPFRPCVCLSVPLSRQMSMREAGSGKQDKVFFKRTRPDREGECQERKEARIRYSSYWSAYTDYCSTVHSESSYRASQLLPNFSKMEWTDLFVQAVTARWYHVLLSWRKAFRIRQFSESYSPGMDRSGTPFRPSSGRQTLPHRLYQGSWRCREVKMSGSRAHRLQFPNKAERLSDILLYELAVAICVFKNLHLE